MIKFDKIIIHGFKSFARKTVIPLFDGFNAVIGPNGSGKSNVTDALIFVLGRNSRSMRAGRMDHVIYNGGHGKTPADYAVVELYLNNSDKTIPEMDEEIIISRKVNRHGTSYYRLNGKMSTRGNITDILKKAGTSPDGNNFIQQGDVTHIIDMKPKERREVIDDVAGIKEYNEKKAKAIEELTEAERNLEDASIILGQKDETVKKLQKERDNAIKVKEMELSLEKARAQMAFTRVNVVRGALENIDSTLKLKEGEKKSLVGNVGDYDDGLESIEKQIKEIENTILKKSVNAELRGEIDEINSRILKREGLINANRREIETLDSMIEKLSTIADRKGEGVGSRSVRAILNSGLDIAGTIRDLGSVGAQFQTAIQIAAGGHINDIVVEKENTAIQGVDYLKSNGLGRVRFLPLDRIRNPPSSAKAELASKMPGILDFAVNLVNYNAKYSEAFRNVFRDTLVADSVDAARKVRGLRVVTLDGELFEAGGAIVGGSINKANKNINISDVTDIREYEGKKIKLNSEIEDIKKEIGDLNILLDEKRALEKKEGGDVVAFQQKKEELEEKIEEMKKSRKGQYEQNLTLDSEVQNLKLRRARLEAEYDTLKLDFEKYKDKEQELEKGDPDKLDREIRSLERSLRNIGLVNMKSIEEFDEIEKDYLDFKKKVENLKEERASIEQMIEQIEEKRKIMFKTTLDFVSKAFSEVYFDVNGGEARLEIEDEEDIESGLLIKAQPKSKKLMTIDLLSGGEKTMTAIAFLFALQRYRPSPFYILDEIDAALDKANAEIIGDIILKYSGSAQFLVISHNDITVRRSKRVYGISMQQGISQVFGVRLDEEGRAVETTSASAV
ncbi:MAG: chromosome segregation protein SMC [Candidatus Aenigmarchaeota archaeon]|nr:chromosome segregation protein SMC [Candidatus Aenigmarchaeota archaeon]